MNVIIAIVGRPNVGKSTLFNRLTKSRNALVDDRPGITRDRLHASVNYNGVPFILVDTGGFEDIGQDPLLGKVRDQVENAIEEAECVILMVDGREGLMPGDREMADTLRRGQKKTFLAVNKVDGPEHDHLVVDFYGLGMEPLYPISAAHGYGVRVLMQDMVKRIPLTRIERESSDQIRVAILGKPNVGKSSLINRVLRSNRLLVSDLPGTTRDAVDSPFLYRGKEYLLIDTAGLRRKARVRERIEKFSMIKALKSLDRCHVAAVIIDADEGISEQDARIFGYVLDKGKGVVLAVNKWDLIKDDSHKRNSLDNEIDRQLKFISFAPRVNLSALTGERVMKLFEKIDMVHEHFSRRLSTSSVNSAIQKMIEKHPPPRIGRGQLKFFYATQTRTRPPTFVVFVNRPEMIHFSYKRFLINQLRERLRLEYTPIRIKFRKK
ncbi:MAG: ribosome biogenesis GTPase Der [Desulfobacteraceae bacterium 4484_190.2]|nr:MAG: ribosome biogenesis GTPase Der [Desulfobacteraceae bacterium 4484_190.2]